MIRNSINKRRAILACASAALAASLAQRAMAVTTIWDGGGANSNWSTIANWAGDVLPPVANDVQFANAFTSGSTIQLNGSRTANGLIIHTLTPFTIAGGASDVLTLTSGVITRDDLLGTESNQLISSGIALGTNANWSIWGSGTLTVNGVISGSGKSLSKFGWGLLVLNGNNTFSGGMLVDESRVQISGNGGGTGAITVQPAAGLELNGGVVSNAMTISGDGEPGWSGVLRGMSSTTLTGPITLAGSSTLDSESGSLIIAGVISDGANTFNLTKTGPGEVRLAVANTYKGATTINDGRLSIANNNSLGTGTVTVNDGGSLVLLSGVSDNLSLTLNGTSTIAGALVGDSGSTSWQGPITLASTSDIGVNAGTLTISGAIGQGATPSSLTKVGPGTLVLSGANTYTGTTTVSAGTLVVGTPPAIQHSGAVNVLNGAELDLGGGGITPVPLTLAGSFDHRRFQCHDRCGRQYAHQRPAQCLRRHHQSWRRQSHSQQRRQLIQ